MQQPNGDTAIPEISGNAIVHTSDHPSDTDQTLPYHQYDLYQAHYSGLLSNEDFDLIMQSFNK